MGVGIGRDDTGRTKFHDAGAGKIKSGNFLRESHAMSRREQNGIILGEAPHGLCFNHIVIPNARRIDPIKNKVGLSRDPFGNVAAILDKDIKGDGLTKSHLPFLRYNDQLKAVSGGWIGLRTQDGRYIWTLERSTARYEPCQRQAYAPGEQAVPKGS